MRYSCVLIVPADKKVAADLVAAEMGWGPESYTIPLGAGGIITHYGARVDVSDEFVGWIKGSAPLPAAVADMAAPVISALIVDFSPDPTSEAEYPQSALWGRAHLQAVIARHGLALSGETD